MIPLYKPYMPPTPDIEKILISGQIAYGKYTEEFEEKLKSYFGTPYLLVTNSFHTAILVALTSLGIKPGYEVVASPMAALLQPNRIVHLELALIGQMWFC